MIRTSLVASNDAAAHHIWRVGLTKMLSEKEIARRNRPPALDDFGSGHASMSNRSPDERGEIQGFIRSRISLRSMRATRQGYAASAGRTRFVISPPISRSTAAMSYWLCRLSQNCALLPKQRPSCTEAAAAHLRRFLGGMGRTARSAGSDGLVAATKHGLVSEPKPPHKLVMHGIGD